MVNMEAFAGLGTIGKMHRPCTVGPNGLQPYHARGTIMLSSKQPRHPPEDCYRGKSEDEDTSRKHVHFNPLVLECLDRFMNQQQYTIDHAMLAHSM